MVLGKPERVSRPYSDELCAVIPKCMQDHVVDAVRLRRAPDHNVEPFTRAWRKEVRAECGEVRPGHHAARCRTKRVLATGGARRSWGAQEERAV
jgi:hypothetical protein